MSRDARLKKLQRQQAQVYRANREDALLPMEPFTQKPADQLEETRARVAGFFGSGGTHYYAAWVNNRYVVLASATFSTEWGRIEHLWIRRTDDRNLFPWADLQRIKDELVGPERVGFEVFPARSKLVDDVDMRHLWVLPAGKAFSFGLGAGDAP